MGCVGVAVGLFLETTALCNRYNITTCVHLAFWFASVAGTAMALGRQGAETIYLLLGRAGRRQELLARIMLD